MNNHNAFRPAALASLIHGVNLVDGVISVPRTTRCFNGVLQKTFYRFAEYIVDSIHAQEWNTIDHYLHPFNPSHG